MNLAGADRPLEAVQPKEAGRPLKCRLSSAMYAPGDKPVVDLEAQAGVVAGTGAVDLGNAYEAVEIGDRVQFAGAQREQVKHLDARAERLDTARDRPRVTDSPRAERRARPDALRTKVPGGAQPCRRAPSLREADERLAGLCAGS